MPYSPDDTPNLPKDTSKKHRQCAKRVEVARDASVLPPLGEHAAPRAIHDLSFTACDGDDLRCSLDSKKAGGRGTIEEDPRNGGNIVEDACVTHRYRAISQSNDVDEHEQADEGDGVSLKKRKPPGSTTYDEWKQSTDVTPNLQPQDPTNPEKVPKSILKSLLERARASSSFSPGAAFKATVSRGVRRFLLMGSDAQVLPLIVSPIDTEERNCSQHLHEKKKNVTELSPLPSSRKRPARGEESPETDKQAFFSGSSVDVDVDIEGYTRKAVGACGQVGLTQVKAAPSNRKLRTSACRRRKLTCGEVPGRAHETISSSDGDCQHTARVDDAGVLAQDEGVVTNFDAPDAREFDTSAMGRSVADRVTEEDLKVKLRGQWPEQLDEEPVAADWALDKSEGEILAVAKRFGSVLVRVATWNLHAKPIPGAEKLREALLPPGKFHIYVIGTQECQNSIAKSVIIHSKKEWEGVLRETLGTSYEMLCGHALQATHNAVFVHRGLIPLLGNVRSSAVATGLSLGTPGTTLGNKGGVAISFTLGSTSCIFVNSHLAAHQANVRERNDHFFQISEGLVRALGPRSSKSSSPANLATTPNLAPKNGHYTTTDDSGGCAASDTIYALRPGALVSGSTSKYVGDSLEFSMEKAEDFPVDGGEMKRKISRVESKGSEPQMSQPPSNDTRRRSEKEVTVTEKEDKYISAPCEVESNPLGPPPNLSLLESASPCVICGDEPHFLRERSRGQQCGGGGGERGKTLPDVFDRVVWSGDLNYRVNVPRKIADALLSNDLHEVLLKNEQLSLERERGDRSAPFVGYQEGPLNFRPTYKFDGGTDRYDTSPKQRVPAWTDRVLFAGAAAGSGEKGKDDKAPITATKGEPSGGMQLKAYRSVMELRTSDHRPVVASFVLEFNQRENGVSGSGEEAAITNQTSSEICLIA